MIPADTEIIVREEEIAVRVRQLALEIAEFYRGVRPVVIPLLKGGFVFAADLIREIDLEMSLEFLGASSYGEETASSGEVRLTLDTSAPLSGKNVLLVEDIVDTGLTLAYIQKLIGSRAPASLRTAVLLDKRARRRVDVEVTWTGFVIPDRFVFGYGLDGPGGSCRNLRNVVALRDERLSNG
jgi:hypoxanthine phosphoribosyltransferase